MNNHLLQMKRRMEKARTRYGKPDRSCAGNGFKCAHCHGYVTLESCLSGVLNRNHCPYCLWSRHLDLYAAGDRLSACKSPMQPIGLTIKTARKKYGRADGELMLIHRCEECHAHSINRIAADDDPRSVFAAFEASFQTGRILHDSLESGGIHLLGETDAPLVRRQLFGNETDPAEMLFPDRILETV
jgi:hypothetical protein